jgi:transcriptional regulator with XRE-family HTH domain
MLSVMKTEERGLARRLRHEEGLPIKEIARRVGVSKSSVSLWVRDIELTEEQQQVLRDRNPAYNRQLSGTMIQAANRRAERIAYQDAGRRRAAEGNALHLAGCMLYWAEGAKNRNQVGFSNSDPDVVRFFVDFLRAQFDVRPVEIALTCYLFADHLQRQREIERFWLEVAGLPQTSLRKSHVNVYSKYSQKKRRNRLPYGTVKVVVSRTRVVQSIYGAIQEYAGFTRPEWLE